MKPPYTYILFADDDSDDQQLLCERLAVHTNSIAFECVSNGFEALHFLRNCPAENLPAIILLDYKMPKLAAPEVLEGIRNDDRYRYIPKIVWSTSRNPADVEKCVRSGADKYFYKPFDMHGLNKIVDFLLSISTEKLNALATKV